MKKLTRDEIKTIMPHREPMLLLDEAWEGGGSYTIKGDEFFLQGHFPLNPIVPGVILCEIMAQSVCVSLQGQFEGKTAFLTGIDGIKIRSKVVPGDTFRTEVSIKKKFGTMFFLDAKGFVGEKLCVSGVLSFAVA
ncbi:MAG: beta-hydroxyacyl-ACP dehydratase [Firmicutes bacterium]|nr:beta-hydroxyacyl-ACP dehydratase [Bacillota bacterium]